MYIRKAESADLDNIMEIYSYARQFMAKNGNPNQWGDDYITKDLIEKDIAQGESYVFEDNQGIQAVFVLTSGDDPTYAVIEDGAWKNDKPYATIHRLASLGKVKGIAGECIRWCFEKFPNLRADTHDDNKIMQHLLEKYGFEKCGIIYVGDGTPRIAYQKVK